MPSRIHLPKQGWKDALVSLHDWIGGVGNVKDGISVISINGYLHRVANIIDAVSATSLRIGKRIAYGVRIL
jgi:mitochondrial fission protein ELM1